MSTRARCVAVCVLLAGCGTAAPAARAPSALPGSSTSRRADPTARGGSGPATLSVAARARSRTRFAAIRAVMRRRARHVRPALAELLRAIATARVITGVRAGRSADGRPITVTAAGQPAAARRVLVVGCIHGTECAGMAVTRLVQRGPAGCPPGDADVWAVPDLDPDGRAAGSRLNGHGIDLNRNFGAGWRPIGRPSDLEYSGARPFSEPETRTARAIVRALRPRVTVWFHQQAHALVRAWGPSVPVARRYAARVGLSFRTMRWLAGTAPHWQNTAFPGTASFVVELPRGPLSARAARRHARAVLALAGVPGPLAGAARSQ